MFFVMVVMAWGWCVLILEMLILSLILSLLSSADYRCVVKKSLDKLKILVLYLLQYSVLEDRGKISNAC